jgi:hypothetical protein
MCVGYVGGLFVTLQQCPSMCGDGSTHRVPVDDQVEIIPQPPPQLSKSFDQHLQYE